MTNGQRHTLSQGLPSGGSPHSSLPPSRRWEIAGLGVLFGLLYFVQGFAEPTEGLIAQPTRSMLAQWQYSSTHIGLFAFAIGIPWTIKPIFGLLSDFVPLGGKRRKSYLLLASGLAGFSLFMLFLFPPAAGSIGWLWIWLFLPTTSIALADVVIDAVMVEKGQPLKMTGRFQSIQWTASYAAMILTGWLGGWLTQHHRQSWGFLICAMSLLPAFLLVVIFLRETPFAATGVTWRDELHTLRSTFRNPMIRAGVAVLFLWNFNPFSTAVLQTYMTSELGWPDAFYGHTVSLQAVTSMAGCAAYGFYCRKVPLPILLHASILLGILSTVSYCLLFDQRWAVGISLTVGFVYVTGNIIQMDMAARICPAGVSATVFATLMAVTNLALSLSYAIGGYLYDWASNLWDPHIAFRALVVIGALTTAGCWFVVPFIVRSAGFTRDKQSPDALSERQEEP